MQLYWRFSPVGTGNTKANLLPARLNPVQPRGYGEHLVTIDVISVISGSAPWVRGTREPMATTPKRITVQPREYGEH